MDATTPITEDVKNTMLPDGLRQAIPTDFPRILQNLRSADRAEVEAVIGVPAEFLIPFIDEGSGNIWTMEASDGEPVGLVGVQPLPGCPELGSIWMLGTDGIVSHSVEFLRKCRTGIDFLFGPYEALTNCVDARNTLHIRWLKWMGFTFIRRIEKHGALSLPFYEFVKIKKTT